MNDKKMGQKKARPRQGVIYRGGRDENKITKPERKEKGGKKRGKKNGGRGKEEKKREKRYSPMQKHRPRYVLMHVDEPNGDPP